MSGGKKSTNLLVKVLLEGVYDEGCVLAKLKGCPHILGIIWRHVRRYWLAQIQLPRSPGGKEDGDKLTDNGEENCGDAEDEIAEDIRGHYNTNTESSHSSVYLAPITDLNQQYYKFPKPTNININMMPFIVGETFKDCK